MYVNRIIKHKCLHSINADDIDNDDESNSVDIHVMGQVVYSK